MRTTFQKPSGFTVIEILIVVTVLAILASISLVTFNGIQHRASDVMVQQTTAEAKRTLQVHYGLNEHYPANMASTNYTPPLEAPVVLYTNAPQAPRYNGLNSAENAQLFLNTCNGFMPVVIGGVRYNNACVYNGNNMHLKGTVSSNVVLQGPVVQQADFKLTCGPSCDTIASSIIDEFVQQGGVFPIVVPKKGSPLPEPELVTMGKATDYCVEVRSSRYDDIIYHATPTTGNYEVGPCNVSGGLHYP